MIETEDIKKIELMIKEEKKIYIKDNNKIKEQWERFNKGKDKMKEIGSIIGDKSKEQLNTLSLSYIF